MAIPEATLKTYEMTQIDRVVEWYANLENPTEADFQRVRVEADVQCQLDKFRLKAIRMSGKKLESERHYSNRLARNMVRANSEKPHECCEAHAMVCGGHKEMEAARAILAFFKMRIDDPRNGCWLPNQLEDRPKMPDWLKNAVPHRRVHRDSYFEWIAEEINRVRVKSLQDLILQLKMVRMRLQSGKVKPKIAQGTGIQ